MPRRKKALAMRDEASRAPTLEVSAAEFRERACQAGWDEAKIALQIRLSRLLGSAVLVGGALLRVSEKSNDEIDLDSPEPPLPPMVDDRTPEQLRADGDDFWPDGTPYVPPRPEKPQRGRKRKGASGE